MRVFHAVLLLVAAALRIQAITNGADLDSMVGGPTDLTDDPTKGPSSSSASSHRPFNLVCLSHLLRWQQRFQHER